MKWTNHQVVTGVIVYAVTEDLLLTACSMAGAIFPDKVEGNPRGGLLSIGWRSRHRGWSHWILLYAALIALLMQVGDLSLVNASGERLLSMNGGSIRALCVFFFVGAILHSLEDAICGKVPLLTPNHKVGIRLFKVGSVMEYVMALGIVVAVYAVKYFLK